MSKRVGSGTIIDLPKVVLTTLPVGLLLAAHLLSALVPQNVPRLPHPLARAAPLLGEQLVLPLARESAVDPWSSGDAVAGLLGEQGCIAFVFAGEFALALDGQALVFLD